MTLSWEARVLFTHGVLLMLKTDRYHDANFVVIGDKASDDKVAILTTPMFQCIVYRYCLK